MAVGEVGRAEADDTGTVTRRTECCTDDCGAERGHTTDVAWPRKVVVGWIDIDGGESDRWRMAVGEGRGVGDCDDDVMAAPPFRFVVVVMVVAAVVLAVVTAVGSVPDMEPPVVVVVVAGTVVLMVTSTVSS